MLIISSDRLQTITNHAEHSYPRECCGLLLGTQDGERKTVVEVWQAENAWRDEAEEYWQEDNDLTEERRYAIAPELMLKAMKEGRERSLSVIGIYHSHPNNPARPSEFDRLYAWPEYSYIIVSVVGGEATEVLSWSLGDRQQFKSEEIIKD
ncbi:MAG: M67 family metallopeptidase [Cyanobacteriota bacterium]|nr:M67 family metallopeptidase [Cyanobacteriota bacterium]